MECPPDATSGQNVDISSINCEVALCAPYTYPASWDHVDLHCENITLPAVAVEHCPLHCMPGYSSNFGWVVCPLDAATSGDTSAIEVLTNSSDPTQSKMTSGIPSTQLTLTQCMSFSHIIGMVFDQIDDSSFPVCGIVESENRMVYNTNSNADSVPCSISISCPVLATSLQCRCQDSFPILFLSCNF